MDNEENPRSLLKKILPRVAKAALKGFIMFLLTYLLPVYMMETIGTIMPPEISFASLLSEYMTLIYAFSAIVVFFTVVREFFSGTILQHVFTISGALVMIMFFAYALNGGVFTSAFPIPGQQQVIHIFADLRAFLAMLIFVNLLGFARGMLEAIDFLSEKVEPT